MSEPQEDAVGRNTATEESPDLSMIIDLTDVEGLSDLSTRAEKPLLISGVPKELRQWAMDSRIAAKSNKKGLEVLVSTVAGWAAAIGLDLVLPGGFGLAACWLVMLFVFLRLQNVTHEGSHRGIFASKAANEVFTGVAGVALFFPVAAYRAYHFTHHGYTRTEGKDSERFYEMVPSRLLLLGSIVFGGPVFVATMLLGTIQCLVGLRPSWVSSDRMKRSVALEGTAQVFFGIATVVVAVTLGRGGELLRWWLIPAAAFMCGPFTWMTFFEHSGALKGAPILQSSGTVKSNRVFSWILLNGNVHLAHHAFPTASWWNLPAVDTKITSVTDVRPEIRHSGFWSFHRNLWSRLRWV